MNVWMIVMISGALVGFQLGLLVGFFWKSFQKKIMNETTCMSALSDRTDFSATSSMVTEWDVQVTAVMIHSPSADLDNEDSSEKEKYLA